MILLTMFKRSLWSHTNSDLACKFEVKGHNDVFDYITSVFGKRWYIRIFNQLGDFTKMDNTKHFTYQ